MFWELSGDNSGGDIFAAMRTTLAADPPESDPCTR
jgi:hypothetical protein